MRRISGRKVAPVGCSGRGQTSRTSTEQFARRSLTGLVAVVVCGALILAGSDSPPAMAAVVPPPGTPDLSQMVLQPSDLSRAGAIQQSGYTTPGSPLVVASYARVFGPSTVGKTKFLGIGSDASLTSDQGAATVVYLLLKGLVQTRQGRQALLKPFIQGFNQTVGQTLLTFREFHFRAVHGLGVGDSSFVLPASFTVHGVRFTVDVAFVRVDRVLAQLTLGSDRRVHAADVRGLAQAIAKNMRTVLAVPTAR